MLLRFISFEKNKKKCEDDDDEMEKVKFNICDEVFFCTLLLFIDLKKENVEM